MLYSSRIVREKKIVVTMIKFYCKKIIILRSSYALGA